MEFLFGPVSDLNCCSQRRSIVAIGCSAYMAYHSGNIALRAWNVSSRMKATTPPVLAVPVNIESHPPS